MKTAISTLVLAMLATLAGCGQRATETPVPSAAASAPDASGQGAGGGGRR